MQILPWFGGSAAVWTTCLVFFQSVLLAGYAYADLTHRLGARRQALLHVGLLALALAVLLVLASSGWKPQGDEQPIARILLLLLATIGLPYFLLSTTTPLLQAWYWRRFRSRVPYRLFALSNLASLLALIGFPLLFEPALDVRPLFIVVLVALLPAMAFYVPSLKLHVAVPLYLIGLFVSCMFCHGELARLKPDPLHLTRYYLMISLGGAFGAVLVAILAPLTLPGYFELGIALVLLALLLVLRLRRIFMWGGLAVSVVTALLVMRGVHDYSAGVRVFDEISPRVVDIARREFTSLADTPARTELVMGDGRLSLEREPPRSYDLLGIDAFSGDSIPMHLVTREAMAVYLKHIKPDGVIVFQATNRFINLLPVVRRLAGEFGLEALNVADVPDAEEGPEYWYSSTDQIIVTRSKALLAWPRIAEAAEPIEDRRELPTFTDSHHNLLRILK